MTGSASVCYANLSLNVLMAVLMMALLKEFFSIHLQVIEKLILIGPKLSIIFFQNFSKAEMY